jgi:uncharacterized protein YdaU (DUF1376 family)
MNYYRRYSGDYLRDTARLNLTEHGAYTLLMDYYYTSEQPLPLDHDELYLMVRAMKPIDRQAVDKVLVLYFTKEPDGYHQKRVDKEIAVSKSARNNGGKGGRPKTGLPTEDETGSQTGQQTGTVTRDGGGLGHPPTSTHQPPAAKPPAAKEKTLGPQVARFEEAWKRYPKRAGNNPKQDGLRAWQARLRDGETPEVMEAGLDRYIAFCEATDKVGSETVMQASRFFGASKCYEQDWALPKANGNGSGPAWWASNEGIQAKAAELGIVAPKGGSWADLKALVSARLGS